MPEPEAADGSYQSMSEHDTSEGNPYVNQADNSVEVYWTGWWPEVHVLITQELSVVCSVFLHVKVDLIGSFDVVESDSNFFGLQAMTTTDQEQAEEDTEDMADSIWSDLSNVLAVAVAISSLALVVCTILMQITGVWQPWLLSLMFWFGSVLALMVELYNQCISNDITGPFAALKYFIMVCSLLGVVVGSLGTLWMIGCRGWTRITQYWTHGRYFKINSETGWKGRSSSGNLIAALVLLGVLLLLSYSLYTYNE
ncbi:MAG: hypothetical protein JW779_05810 [Candidatus Thorarchaeota archaeon]|nr:hypothetical protein [Candidatus Thorarchaeota archaeon]